MLLQEIIRPLRGQDLLMQFLLNTDLVAQAGVDMEGMDIELANELALKGVCSMEDLAEQSVDELMEIDGMDEARASELIMTARAPWFAEEEKAEQE